MPDAKYNSSGIAQTGPAMNQSPSSNPGIVYQPANTPTNPGALKVAQQSTRNITFKAQDGGIVNIGTQSASPAVIVEDGNFIGGAAGILIADKDYTNPVNPSNPAVVLLDTFVSPTAMQIQNRADADTPISLSTITNFSAQGSSALSVASTLVISSHFNWNMDVSGVVFWTSDGTTPNGNLNGETGDICLNGPSGDLFTCVSGTTWTDTGGGGGGGGGIPLTFSGNNTTAGSTTQYISPLGASLTEAGVEYTVYTTGTVSKLSIGLVSGQPASGSLTFNMRHNAANSGISIVIPPSAGGGFYFDTTHSFSLVSGDTIDFQMINAGSTNSANPGYVTFLIS